ncbi:acyl carrier protein [Azohydromonas caseinilytica]|uniref:Acyl carrier protein n=1 Tax=Azohydromonas caseinilytica TaxID=2728836 RepID=A0A848FDC4_9BURK|nr:phosphopantetheine-binding protein [Azohydromonas caseinilytica]NML18207.1 acyl carrier protein [Azohydromonas caseinilytica]
MTADPSALQERIRDAIVATVRTVAPEADFGALNPERALREELDLDSFDFLNVLIELHARLGVEVPEADYARITTLNALSAYLRQRLQG